MSDRPRKSLTMTVLMTPDTANFSGNVHGGSLLKLLDQVAYACAAQYCKSYVVTASLDHLAFKAPIKVGELVTFLAHVNFTGKTSMEVGVKIMTQDLHTDEQRHACSCYFTMVAKDDQGNSREVPQLEPQTDVEKALFEAGRMRREMRKEMLERNRALHVVVDQPLD
ncbi:MAG: acyl-CoA thioesterase [Pseudomonadota bacterium]